MSSFHCGYGFVKYFVFIYKKKFSFLISCVFMDESFTFLFFSCKFLGLVLLKFGQEFRKLQISMVEITYSVYPGGFEGA
jgi:hypothetical protein